MKKKIAGFVSGVLSVFPNTAWANGQRGEGGWHMMDGMMEGGIFMWILLIVIIGGIVYWQMTRSNKQLFGTDDETPLEILQKRYAKGKITKEEYEQMKHDLNA